MPTPMSAEAVDTAEVAGSLKARWAQLVSDGPTPGGAWLRAATASVDGALARLAAPYVDRQRLAVVAVGGYGRGELAPRSDIDLVLLHDRLDKAVLEQAVRGVVYPLWDAGLTVGYAVRDRREAVSAPDEVDSATAMLDLRVLAGDPGFVSLVRGELIRRLRRRPHRFLGALREADRQRREQAGDAAEVLEPNLKDGAGGLRDVQSLRWAAAALVGTVGLDPLVPAGYLGAPDRPRLAAAEGRLLAIRCALQLEAAGEGGKADVLRLDRHDGVARALGYVDRAEHDLAPHGLLRDLYLATRTVDHVHRRAWALIDADLARGRRRLGRPTERVVDGFELVDGVLRIPAEVEPTEPGLATRLLVALTETGAVLERGSAARLRNAAAAVAPVPGATAGVAPVAGPDGAPGRSVGAAPADGAVTPTAGADAAAPPAGDDVAAPPAGDDVAALPVGDDVVAPPAGDDVAAPPAGDDDVPPWTWRDVDRHRLVRVLQRGHVALPALAELDDVGVWTALLPEWAPLRGRAQRNPYHRYALDRHAWHAAAELGELLRREPWAAETLLEVEDREALVLGTLLHDVGKVLGEPHSETGMPLAAALARRMGAAPETVARIEQLVLLHLVLPDAAQRRDVADPALAVEVAERLGDRSMLAMLHLLAVADGRATGPTSWTSWTDALVRRLVTKVRAVFDELDPDEVGDGAVVTARAAQELATVLGATPELVRDHLAQLPRRYAAAVSPRAVVRHALLASSRPEVAEVRTRVTPGQDDPDGHEGLDELDVVAVDHPGWFAKVAGVVALHGGSIEAADAFTREDGLAVDTFKVAPPEGAVGSWWARVEGDLDEAAGGRLAVRARVLRKAAAEHPRLERLPDVPARVDASEDPSGRATVLEVRALDRIGVLYTIATALAELEVDIVVARVQTLGPEVTDVFYLTDRTGRPLSRDHLAELELAVLGALAEL